MTLREPVVAGQLDRLAKELSNPELELPLIQQLFSLVQRERPADWGLAETLIKAVCEEVEEIVATCLEARTAGGVPFNRIACGVDRVSSYLRWQLLKNFVGEDPIAIEPRVGADISSIVRGAGDVPVAVVSTQSSRIEDDLAPSALLEQYARTAAHLANLRDTERESIQQSLFEIIGETFDPEDPGPFLRTLLGTVCMFPENWGMEWLAKAFRKLIPPHRVLPALQELEDGLNTRLDLDLTTGGPIDDQLVAPGLLDLLLSPRDTYALDLALQGVLRATGDGERRWLNAFRRVLGGRDASNWLRQNSRRFFTGNGLRALFELPPELIVQEVGRNCRDFPEKIVEVLRRMTDFSRLETAIVIGHIMEKGNQKLVEATLRFLVERAFPEMLVHLERLLDQANQSSDMDDLAVLACRSLAEMDDAPARELLERIQSERTFLGYRWRKPIRKAASGALKRSAR